MGREFLKDADKGLERFKKISLLFISSIIALFLTESIFYLSPYLRNKYAIERFITFSPRLTRQLNKEPYLYRPSSRIGYERVPNSTQNINSLGFIGKEIDIKKKEGVFRILILGDSLIEQNYFVEHLRSRVEELRGGIEFEIVNAGVSAYEVWHYARVLKYKGMRLNPDMVIVSLCLNDFAHPYEVYYKTNGGFMEFRLPWKDAQNRAPINISFLKHFYLYRLIIASIDKFYQTDGAIKDDRVSEGIYHMRKIKKICQDNKTPFFCFIWPYFMPYKDYADYYGDQEYSDMIKVLNLLKIDYVDLHDYFPDAERKSFRKEEGDYIHPSDNGHAIAAKAIFGHLIKNYSHHFYHE